MNTLFPLIEKISDQKLKGLTVKCWEEAIRRGGWQKEDLNRIPFTLLPAKYVPSILIHTNAVTESAVAMSHVVAMAYGVEAKVDMNILIAGGILHDVGKVLEYSVEDGKFVKSSLGKWVRHPVSGASLAAEMGLPIGVIHIIASHSYEGDKTPRSVEAILVHHADFANFESLGGKA